MNKKKIYRNLTILATVVAFMLVLIMVMQFVMIGVEMSKTSQLEKEIEGLNSNIENLKDEVEYRKSLLYIEKYARETLGLYGKNDIIFVPKG